MTITARAVNYCKFIIGIDISRLILLHIIINEVLFIVLYLLLFTGIAVFTNEKWYYYLIMLYIYCYNSK